jgi:hypothetical protein
MENLKLFYFYFKIAIITLLIRILFPILLFLDRKSEKKSKYYK